MNTQQQNESQLFIELFNYRPEWIALDIAQREAFADRLSAAMNALPGMGIKVIAWGTNDKDTDRRAPYDFYCAYEVASAEIARKFEAGIAQGDWHRYFDQVVISGAAESPNGLLEKLVQLQTP